MGEWREAGREESQHQGTLLCWPSGLLCIWSQVQLIPWSHRWSSERQDELLESPWSVTDTRLGWGRGRDESLSTDSC